MAKIYETREDFERDKLKDQSKDLRIKEHSQSSLGITMVGTSLALDLFRMARPSPGWLRIASNVLSIGGLIEIVRSWFTSSKAHSLELERDRMGPERIVLPAEMTGAEKECHTCPDKRYAHIEPRSHGDYAAKTDSGKFI